MSFKKDAEEVSLSELLDVRRREMMMSLNCHAIGIVEEFDSTNQTVKARVAYKKKYYEKNGKQYKPVLVDYPFLIDCPVVVLSGGDFSMKMPIKQGDECVVLFNDRSIDNWFQSGNVLELDSDRLHSFSDGLVLVGVRSLARSIEGYEENKLKIGDQTHDLVLGDGEATLKKGESVVSVKDKITIKNSSKNLNQLLQDLINEISSATVSCPNSGSGTATEQPLLNKSAISAIASQIGELLE